MTKDIKILLNDYLEDKALMEDIIFHLEKNNSNKKEVIYTPLSIVKKMISISNIQKHEKIIEPACGHGAFLFSLLDDIDKKYNMDARNLYDWFINSVTGIDLQKETINDLKILLHYYFKKKGLIITEFKNIICGDALYYNLEMEYDLCIGNPPYITSKNIEHTYLEKLRKDFISCKKGNIDIYYAFIEKYISISKKICFITPRTLLINDSTNVLMNSLIDKMEVLIDFKDKQIFKNAKVCSCIFLANNENKKFYLMYGNNLQEDLQMKCKDFLLKKEKIRKNENIKVLSGVATLSDASYIVRKIDDKFIAEIDGVNYEIEEDIIKPYIKITKQKNEKNLNISYMIYPYDKNKKIIEENIIKDKFPKLHKYLFNIKDKLLARDKGKVENYESWYAYGRKQGLHNIDAETVILIPRMIGGNCKPFKINIKDILRNNKVILFNAGFLVPITDLNKIDTEALLSEDFINFVKQNGKDWSSKNSPYYSLTTNNIYQFLQK